MTLTKNQAKMASSLLLVSILFSIALTYATTEDDYDNDTNIVTNVFEGTFAESGYKANIFINPEVTGVYASEGSYKLNLAININGVGHALTENNYKLDLIPQKSFPEQHDLKATNIELSRAIVGKGYNVSITVTVANQELNYETFNLIIYATATTINTQIVTVTSRAATAVTFKWNTTDFAYGYYTISATAHPVPGEAFTADNTLTNGVVMVTIPGDIDGDSGHDVDRFDFGLFAQAYGSTEGPPPSPNWNPNADIDGCGTVTRFDFGIFASNYGKSW